MIPLATSIFWGPMAITIMGGLLVATMLTLLVVPALYSIWFRVRSDETETAHDLSVAAAVPFNHRAFEQELEPLRIAAE
jgi:hypothetical protein